MKVAIVGAGTRIGQPGFAFTEELRHQGVDYILDPKCTSDFEGDTGSFPAVSLRAFQSLTAPRLGLRGSNVLRNRDGIVNVRRKYQGEGSSKRWKRSSMKVTSTMKPGS